MAFDEGMVEQDTHVIDGVPQEIAFEELDERSVPADHEARAEGRDVERPVFDRSVFGDFEDEEEIALGTDFARSPSHDGETPLDLESVLHHEIVGLNEYLSETILSARDLDAEIDCMESIEDETFGTPEPEEVVEDFVEVPEDAASSERLRIESEVAAETSAAEPEFPEEACQQKPQGETRKVSDLEQAGCSIVSIAPELETNRDDQADEALGKRDDSDLLVIEDEVEVRRIDAAKRFDSSEKTISVDFQAMLSRMRSGSNRA
jgi:hypothetical protein